MLLKLVKQKGDKFDHIFIETTGKSHSNRTNVTVQVLQNLVLLLKYFSDELVTKYVKLDGVVTLVA